MTEKIKSSLGMARAIMVLLVVQFCLGMLANLYSEVPQDHPAEVFDQFGYIMLHVINGTLLIVLGVVFLVQARKRRAYVREAVSGLAAMVAAYVFGEMFIFTQNDLLSFLMAGSFVGALLPYARVLYLSQPKST